MVSIHFNNGGDICLFTFLPYLIYLQATKEKKMKLKRMHWFGIIAAGILLLINIVYYSLRGNLNLFLFLGGICLTILFMPFVIGIVLENRKEENTTEMFLEFSRNLAESVATGTPVSKSIVNMRNKNYGVLTLNITKLDR